MKKFLAIYLGTPAGREKWMQIQGARVRNGNRQESRPGWIGA